MVIHIIPIGVNTEHVQEGLKEITPVSKVYLLHSKNDKKFKGLTEAKKLKKDLESHFGPIVLEEIDAFEISSVYLKIQEIVKKELKTRDGGVLIKSDFAVGITGGTNPMACGAIIGATLEGVDAYYVRNRNFEPNREFYVEKLPLPSKAMILRVQGLQLEILKKLSKGSYEDYQGNVTDGMMRRTILLNELGISPNTLNSAIRVLKTKELVKQYDEGMVRKIKEGLYGKPEYVDVMQKFVRYEITDHGKYQIQRDSTITTEEITNITK
jgi:hypothetical protein